MSSLNHVQPLLCPELVRAQLLPHRIIQDLQQKYRLVKVHNLASLLFMNIVHASRPLQQGL